MTNKEEGLKVEVGPRWTISSIAAGGILKKEPTWPNTTK